MTSDDVKFTLERLLDDKFASPNKSKVSGIERDRGARMPPRFGW